MVIKSIIDYSLFLCQNPLQWHILGIFQILVFVLSQKLNKKLTQKTQQSFEPTF